MTKVKIELAPGQTPEQAEEVLFKAISGQRDGDAHETEAFLDPAMQHQAQVMNSIHERIFDQMMDEIVDVIETEG